MGKSFYQLNLTPSIVVIDNGPLYYHVAFGDKVRVYTGQIGGLPLPNINEVGVPSSGNQRLDRPALSVGRLIGGAFEANGRTYAGNGILKNNVPIFYLPMKAPLNGNSVQDRLDNLNACFNSVQRVIADKKAGRNNVVAISLSDDLSSKADEKELLSQAVGAIFAVYGGALAQSQSNDTEAVAVVKKKMYSIITRLDSQLTIDQIPIHHDFQKIVEDITQAATPELQMIKSQVDRFCMTDQVQSYLNGSNSLTVTTLSDLQSGVYVNRKRAEIDQAVPVFQEARNQVQALYQQAAGADIAFFNVDMASAYGFAPRGLEQAARNENDDARKTPPEPHQSLVFSNTCLYDINTRQGVTGVQECAPDTRGGISSLVPKVTGVYYAMKQVEPTLTPRRFFTIIKDQMFSDYHQRIGYQIKKNVPQLIYSEAGSRRIHEINQECVIEVFARSQQRENQASSASQCLKQAVIWSQSGHSLG